VNYSIFQQKGCFLFYTIKRLEFFRLYWVGHIMAQGLTLNIGVNFIDAKHYGSDGALKGCVNDAKAMNHLALGQGFKGQMLLNESATRENVIRSINQAAASLQSGDIFFISYSGHGSRVPDINRDEDDGMDESWCLYDAQLMDDELNVFWSRFKAGVRVLVVSDSCHSGTITKPGETEVIYTQQIPRFLPLKQMQEAWKANEAFYTNLMRDLPRAVPDIKASVRLLSGCQDNQYSYDGEQNGAFTTQLLQVWAGGRFQGNYQQFHKKILAGMPAIQSPNHSVIGAGDPPFDQQIPFEI
jgi:metacaspase-1